MAPFILKAKYYLLFLIDQNTTTKQARLVLGTANKIQLLAITEVFNNISHLTTSEDKNIRRTVKRYSKLIAILSSTSSSLVHKQSVIRKNLLITFKLILLLKTEIYHLLSQ